ncbi:hypothetical protein BGZ65_009052, partial [Modicella reniformis]
EQEHVAPLPVQQQQPSPVLNQPTNPFNPTLYDDKTEVDEDGAPVYNGYRDTIIGAYSQPQGDDEDEENETPVPTVPSTVSVTEESNQPGQGTATPALQRKKSVKFTGVPDSGPIETLATQGPSTPQQKQQQKRPGQQQMYHSDIEDDDFDHDAYEEDEDIKMRLLETEVPSPASSNARPHVNTTPGGSPMSQQRQQQQQGELSPIRSVGQGYSASASQFQQPSSANFPAPPQLQTPTTSPNLDTVSSLGDGFYEDVLAAVDMNAKTLPSVSPSITATTSTAPHSPTSQTQQSVQHLLPIHVEQETFGAPSPRMTPTAAVAAGHQQKQGGNHGYPSPPASEKPTLSPRSAARPTPDQHTLQQQSVQRVDGGAEYY